MMKSRADLLDADLSGADLSDADLSRADLHDADLSGADLHDADLSGADLRDADLSAASLAKANLDGADLRFADVSHALHPLPGPYPRYRRLISTRRGGVDNQRNTPHNTPLTVQLTVATSHLTIPPSPSNGSGPPQEKVQNEETKVCVIRYYASIRMRRSYC